MGHGGTLDPAVTGVLPIALGPATRLLPYLEGDKTYRGVVQLGVRTVSDDLEGEVLERTAERWGGNFIDGAAIAMDEWRLRTDAHLQGLKLHPQGLPQPHLAEKR